METQQSLVQLEPFDKNEEMGALIDTFNHMSGSLEESFNRIYVEEIAQRDATLKALQSQINPHFLNNTLEIINWKARLSGNEEVSEMIGALSVMMNATMNRDNEMFVPLSEELCYVDAYLTIIRQRFGSTSIGIRNVNLRLHLIYGAGSGLSIFDREGKTVSLLRICREP